MNSFLFGRKQYSPICNIEEGDESSLKLKLHDGVSPMTYKKLKEIGYTSDDWANWSDDEKVKKSQEGGEGKSSESVEKASNGKKSSSNTEEDLSNKASEDNLKRLRSEYRKAIQTYNSYHQKLDNLNKQAYDAIKSKYPSAFDYLQKNKINYDEILESAGSSKTDDKEWREDRPLLSFSENSNGYRLDHMFGRLAYRYYLRTGQSVESDMVDNSKDNLAKRRGYKEGVDSLKQFTKSPEYKIYQDIVNATEELGDEYSRIRESDEMNNARNRAWDLKDQVKKAEYAEMVKEVPELIDNKYSIREKFDIDYGKLKRDISNIKPKNDKERKAADAFNQLQESLKQRDIWFHNFNKKVSFEGAYKLFKQIKAIRQMLDSEGNDEQ